MKRSKFTTKTESVAVRIRAAINRGEIKPGDPIRIKEWSEQLRVSPTPLREALQTLATEGYVQLSPQRGFQVAAFSAHDLMAAYLLRRALHAVAAELVASRANEQDRKALVRTLKAHNAQYGTALEEGNMALADRVNYRFHRAIIAAARSSLLERIRAMVFSTAPADLGSFWQMVRESPTVGSQLVEEHDHIISAIERADAVGAAFAATRHAEAATVQLLDRLKTPDLDGAGQTS